MATQSLNTGEWCNQACATLHHARGKRPGFLKSQSIRDETGGPQKERPGVAVGRLKRVLEKQAQEKFRSRWMKSRVKGCFYARRPIGGLTFTKSSLAAHPCSHCSATHRPLASQIRLMKCLWSLSAAWSVAQHYHKRGHGPKAWC